MRIRHALFVAAAVLAMACISRADSTITVNVSLDASAQNYVATGIGPNFFGDSQWFIQQGSCSASGGNTTCNLTGAFTGTTPGFTSGTYDLVTTYAGTGPSPLQGTSTLPPPSDNSFFFSFIPAGTLITLDLTPTGGAESMIPMFNGTFFVNGYSVFFTEDTAANCSGTAVPFCTFGEVGQTPGAVFSSPVTGNATFTETIATPEPSTLAFFAIGFAGLMVLGCRKRLNFPNA